MSKLPSQPALSEVSQWLRNKAALERAQPHGRHMDAREWAATCLACAAEDIDLARKQPASEPAQPVRLEQLAEDALRAWSNSSAYNAVEYGFLTEAILRALQQATAQKDAEIARLKEERDAALRFKAYVHRRLNEAGVPTDPESPHKAEGCRIGGRLDVLFTECDAALQRCGELERELNSDESRLLQLQREGDAYYNRSELTKRLLATERAAHEATKQQLAEVTAELDRVSGEGYGSLKELRGRLEELKQQLAASELRGEAMRAALEYELGKSRAMDSVAKNGGSDRTRRLEKALATPASEMVAQVIALARQLARGADTTVQRQAAEELLQLIGERAEPRQMNEC